ncbi:MAG: YcxB family protein [Thermoanaerobaculia bacterium]|nr:YcxB family protein [Thermoanaerobaculia bacterium]
MTRRLLKRGLFRYVTGVRRAQIGIAGVCLLVFAVLALSPSVRPLLKGVMLAMAAMSSLAFAGRVAGTLRRSGALLDKLGGEVRTSFRVDGEGIRLENPLGVSSVSWRMIEDVWVFDDVWLLFIGKVDYMTIPVEALGVPGASEFLRLARLNGRRICGRMRG